MLNAGSTWVVLFGILGHAEIAMNVGTTEHQNQWAISLMQNGLHSNGLPNGFLSSTESRHCDWAAVLPMFAPSNQIAKLRPQKNESHSITLEMLIFYSSSYVLNYNDVCVFCLSLDFLESRNALADADTIMQR